MGKIIFISILMLLILVVAAAVTRFSDKSNIVNELESFDIEEEEEAEEESELFDIEKLWRSERGSKVLVNVDSFGAAGDGVSDDTKVKFIALNGFLYQIDFFFFFCYKRYKLFFPFSCSNYH